MKFTSKNMDGFIKEIWNLTQEKKTLNLIEKPWELIKINGISTGKTHLSLASWITANPYLQNL